MPLPAYPKPPDIEHLPFPERLPRRRHASVRTKQAVFVPLILHAPARYFFLRVNLHRAGFAAKLMLGVILEMSLLCKREGVANPSPLPIIVYR